MILNSRSINSGPEPPMETIRQAQGRRATFKRSEDFNRWNLWHDWNVWNGILPNPTTGTTGTTGTSGTVFSEFAIMFGIGPSFTGT